MDVKVDLPKHYIEIEGSLAQRRLRTLKHGDAFAVVDEYGDIGVVGTGPEGLYFNDTRFLSWYDFRFEGMRPLLLGSVVQDDNVALSVNLTNPDVQGTVSFRFLVTRLLLNAPSFFGRPSATKGSVFVTTPTVSDISGLRSGSAPISMIFSKFAEPPATAAAPAQRCAAAGDTAQGLRHSDGYNFK